MVWYASDGHDYEIVTWTPTGGAVTLTDTECDEVNPQVSGDRVVWQGYDGHDYEIVTWTPTGGAVQLTRTQLRDLFPQVSGDRIVWQGMDSTAHYFEVCLAVPEVPFVEGASPDLSLSSGGTQVTVSGGNFIGVKAVRFGDVPASSYRVISPSEIRVTAPAHDGGTVQVQVVAEGGVSGDGGGEFVYLTPSYAEQSDPLLTYIGTWSTAATSLASGGSYALSTTAGSGAMISFRGAGAQLLATTGKWSGIAYVSVDGAAAVPVDLYSSANVYKKLVYDTGELAPGDHTLSIRYSGTKNGKSGGYAISIDAVQLSGALAQAPKLVRHQQGDERFRYTGVWSNGITWSASGGDFSYADGPGAAVNVLFDGTYLAWYAKTGPQYGRARVSLDGKAPVYVDLYSSRDAYKKLAYQTGMLADGEHTLSIYWIGQKNPSAIGYRVDVDTFDVVGDLLPAADPAPIAWVYEQTDQRLAFLGNWPATASKYASGGSLRYASAYGTAMTTSFTGTSFALVARTGPNHGIAYVSVDGAPPVSVDLYSSYTQYQRRVYSSALLEYGPHTVTISRSGTKNGRATGYVVDVDALQITGTVTQAPLPTRYQQDDAKVSYEGTWATNVTWAASAGSYKYCGSADSRVTVEFVGTHLSWFAKTGPGFGKAKVSLDGGTAFYVDLYSSKTLYKQVVYSTGLLSSGSHTMTIEWAGSKNPASAGTYIDVDGFDILGTIGLPPGPVS